MGYHLLTMKSLSPINSERALRFVEEFAKDRNGTQAAIRAGYSERTAGQQANALLKNPKITKLIEEACSKVAEAAKFEAVDVLRNWVEIATADPTKITHVRTVNCRHCWGVGHAYQWKVREYAEACDRAANNVDGKTGQPRPLPMPKCDGGFGFVSNKPPHPECAECHGEGEEETHYADMANLAPAERRLIASVNRGKHGPEIKYRDQDGALAKIAGYLGMLVDKKEITGKDGGPLAVATIPVELPADSAQLAALYGKLL